MEIQRVESVLPDFPRIPHMSSLNVNPRLEVDIWSSPVLLGHYKKCIVRCVRDHREDVHPSRWESTGGVSRQVVTRT